jgi:hypothetical protein
MVVAGNYPLNNKMHSCIHVCAQLVLKRTECRILVTIPERKRQLERHMQKWKDNIKMELK